MIAAPTFSQFSQTAAAQIFRDEAGGTMGTEDLCVWKDFGDRYVIQTRNPKYARKLSRRSDTFCFDRYAVSGGYLRFYGITAKRRSKVRNLLRRYLAVTNEHFSALTTPADTPKRQVKMRIAGRLPQRTTRHNTQTGHK